MIHEACTKWRTFSLNSMMTSSNGNISHVTGHLCGEFTGHRWIPRTKASDAELWCFIWSALNKRLSKQWRGWWFQTSSRSLWRHCNAFCFNRNHCIFIHMPFNFVPSRANDNKSPLIRAMACLRTCEHHNLNQWWPGSSMNIVTRHQWKIRFGVWTCGKVELQVTKWHVT